MCLVLLAYRLSPDWPLLLAANRDEYYERPTAAAAFWEEHLALVGGRDLQKHGTWLGVTRAGRFAAVTNFRQGLALKKNAPSRGTLVSSFLTRKEMPQDYLQRLQQHAAQYDGFNLIAGDVDEVYYYSNRGRKVQKLAPGLYGLSNHLLDTPWPKVERGKKRLIQLFSAPQPPAVEALFAILADRFVPIDKELPNTGIGLERERQLSAAFTASADYGTRSSTLLFIHSNNRVQLIERSFKRAGIEGSTVHHEFMIDATSLI
ncbi:MAG TPA: NRDE family protein [Burkholderiales bacterium]|nr:NRDE family protein [Burkholderiales bacterium]